MVIEIRRGRGTDPGQLTFWPPYDFLWEGGGVKTQVHILENRDKYDKH